DVGGDETASAAADPEGAVVGSPAEPLPDGAALADGGADALPGADAEDAAEPGGAGPALCCPHAASANAATHAAITPPSRAEVPTKGRITSTQGARPSSFTPRQVRRGRGRPRPGGAKRRGLLPAGHAVLAAEHRAERRRHAGDGAARLLVAPGAALRDAVEA